MVSKQLTVSNSQGMHMRPATQLANAMAKYSSEITIECSGDDEQACLDEAVGMFEANFGE